MAKKYDELDATIVANHLQVQGVKGDASDMGIWTAQELHKIRSTAYEKEYPAGSALRVFPVTNELSDTDKTFEYQIRLATRKLSPTTPTICRLWTR